MRYIWIGFTALLLLSGCSSWGDYVHKSSNFDLKVIFPDKWEVRDRSDSKFDRLEATIPDDVPEARISVSAKPMAPDIHVNEIYPMFMDGGGDASYLFEFEIIDKGMISAKKSEGRFIIYTYLPPEGERIQGMRVLLLGFRIQVNLKMEMPKDSFNRYEREFREMIRYVEVKQL